MIRVLLYNCCVVYIVIAWGYIFYTKSSLHVHQTPFSIWAQVLFSPTQQPLLSGHMPVEMEACQWGDYFWDQRLREIRCVRGTWRGSPLLKILLPKWKEGWVFPNSCGVYPAPRMLLNYPSLPDTGLSLQLRKTWPKEQFIGLCNAPVCTKNRSSHNTLLGKWFPYSSCSPPFKGHKMNWRLGYPRTW